MTEWMPIETAPSDDTVVDLWVRHGDGSGHRVPTCRRNIKSCWPWWKNNSGKWFTGRRYFDTDEGDTVYDPGLTDEGSVVATHWMPLPDPPK